MVTFHLEAPSSIYIWVWRALHLHPDKKIKLKLCSSLRCVLQHFIPKSRRVKATPFQLTWDETALVTVEALQRWRSPPTSQHVQCFFPFFDIGLHRCVQMYTWWILDAWQVLLLHLPDVSHAFLVDKWQPCCVSELPHGVKQRLNLQTCLFHTPRSPATVPSQFFGCGCC